MCGIAGIASGRPIEADRLEAMLRMLDHRGPDDRGIHIEPGAGLAHSRLSVVDLAGGRQPMSNEDGSLWITFNGEIFNYRELRQGLAARGHQLRTQSDTEVILHLFEEQGAAVVQQLNGQWAFAIWNTRSRQLFVSRDRLGVRPLYYTVADGQLLFASEIKALFAHPQVARELDPRGLDNIFTFWSTLPPRTIFKGIHELPAGHSMTWADGQIAITEHWRPSYPAAEALACAPKPRSGEGWSASAHDALHETLRNLLEQATRRRLQADVPVGAYLSGGLDSSLVSALAARAGSSRLATFSIAFDDSAYDESSHQREVAALLGSDHHELRCSSEDISRALPDVVWHAETTLLRTAPAPLFLLSKAVRDNGFKVVLTGEGADEMFGGYDIFKEAKIRRFWAQRPSSTRRASLLKRLYPYMASLQRQPAAYLQAFFHVSPDDLGNPLFSHLPRWGLTSRLKMFFSDDLRSTIGSYDGYSEMASRLPADYAQWHPFCQNQYLETANLLPGYLLSSQGDRMAMAHGIECRYPFLDQDVVSYASALPPTLKMKGLNEKYLLKRVARDLIPASVAKRTKQPYRAPEAHTMLAHDHTGYFGHVLSPEQLRRDGIFDADAVARLLQKSRSRNTVSVKDDMALVGILSTQIVVDRFINDFTPVPYGHHHHRTADIHRR
jgi:asparagine synthase (glutamine-hydrolysing)